MPNKLKPVKTNVRSVLCKEPTMEELWGAINQQDLLFDPHAVLTGREPMPQALLSLVGDLEASELPKLTPSELLKISEGVQEVLSDFLPLLGNLHAAVGLIKQLVMPTETPSNPLSTPSSPTGT